jgi:hypothetical protein
MAAMTARRIDRFWFAVGLGVCVLLFLFCAAVVVAIHTVPRDGWP